MSVAASIDFDISLQPKQAELFSRLVQKGYGNPTNLGYGGSRGGSKSGGAQRCALALALSEANIGICIFRRLSDDLVKNHVNKMLDTWPQLNDLYAVQAKKMTFPNGSYIEFVHAETSQELKAKTRGIEWKYIFIDQCEELSEESLKRFETCNRWPGTGPGECKVVYLFNPGGPGTEYLRRVFFLKQYHDQEDPHAYYFIQAYGWDNYQWLAGTGKVTEHEFYALSDAERFHLFVTYSDYGRKMNALPEALRMGELMGRFDSFAGQYFAGVWDESKLVLGVSEAQNVIESWWPKWIAQDWGFAHHCVTIWATSGKLSPVDLLRYFGTASDFPVDVVILYRELVVSKTAEDDLAEQIVEMTPNDERQVFSHFDLSPDAFAKRGAGNTIAETITDVMQRHGFPAPEPADDDRIGGWRLMHNGFKQTCALHGGFVSREQAAAGPMVFISANCPNVIGSLPMLIRDEKRMEDVLKAPTLADDVADAARYCLKRWADAKVQPPREVRAARVYNAYEDMTEKAMAMRHFYSQENKRSVLRRGLARH
jgi:hypothetical protein